MTMKKIAINWLFCLVTVYTFGQDSCRYVADKKVCYEISTTKMLVKSETLDVNDITKALQNTVAGSLKNIRHLTFPFDGIFLVEMENTSKENMLELIRQWHFREDVLSASPIYLDEYGEDADGYTNELFVKLKSKDDYPVLQQYTEAYYIEIKPDRFGEINYTLTLPSNSEKNTLDIANELYETGFFRYAEPEFIIFGKLGEGNNNIYFPDQWKLRKESSLFTVYPNPANDVLYIEIDRQTNSPACELNIYSLHGSKAFQTATNGNKAEINVSVLQNGIYFLHLHDISSGKQDIKKIMIKHE
jgi:hypothetical protein